MKLYFSKGACSLAVRIIIHEIGLSCEFESVNLKTKKTENGSDFYKINPKGAVPVLELDDESVLTENAVIQQYLADTNNATQLLPPVSEMKRYRVLEWLNYISTEIHKGFGPLFNPTIPEPIKNEIFKPSLITKFDFIEKTLKPENKFLMGDDFTLPDAYLCVMLHWLPLFKIEISKWSNLNRYYDEIKKRKSVNQSFKEEGLESSLGVTK